jgi:hypothetical protein
MRGAGHADRVRRDGLLLLIGVALLVVAAVSVIAGAITQAPLLTLGTLLAAGVVLGAGLLRARGAASVVRTGNPARTMAIAQVIVIALGVMGSIALIVAVVVAEGEARGHAVGHLVFGIVALALFTGLAFLWRPEPGTNASFLRGASLSLLGIAAFGFFLESLGGAGYDAANEGHRIEALAAVHGMAMPIAAIGIPGILFGAVVGLVVLTTWGFRRVRAIS